MDFTAIDVETANESLASICAIGLVRFENSVPVHSERVLVDPEDEFCDLNIAIHGISPSDIKGAPKFPDIAKQLLATYADTTFVHHTHFDRAAIRLSCERYAISNPEHTWLDTARVARRTWKQFSKRGYGLANVAEHLGIVFNHHDPLDDARTAGELLIAASAETGLGLDDWLARVEQPITPTSSPSSIALEGDPDGIFSGEELVFTGSLEVPRRQAADLAARAGCNVKANVSKKTTLLVVGDQDIMKLAGHQKSTKHRKAEELVRGGQELRVLCESDFYGLLRAAGFTR